jgi:putative transposase
LSLRSWVPSRARNLTSATCLRRKTSALPGLLQNGLKITADNPFSEAQFKTLKYRPDFPRRFTSIEAARAHCQLFFPWYNEDHRHGGLGLHTAADIHHGQATAVRTRRADVLTAAYLAHPEHFVRKPPAPPELPAASWINPPGNTEAADQ